MEAVRVWQSVAGGRGRLKGRAGVGVECVRGGGGRHGVRVREEKVVPCRTDWIGSNWVGLVWCERERRKDEVAGSERGGNVDDVVGSGRGVPTF
jgi:hypothetical protein